MKGGSPVAYYSTSGGSVGLQAGVQTYGYAMFFMNDKALQQLDDANGFEVGVGPTVVVLDEGKAKQMTTTTAKDDIYAFIFSQKGLMAGLGIQGNRRSKRKIRNRRCDPVQADRGRPRGCPSSGTTDSHHPAFLNGNDASQLDRASAGR